MKLNIFVILGMMSSQVFALEMSELYKCMDSLSNTVESPVISQIDPSQDFLNPRKAFPLKNRSITLPNESGEFVMVTVTENNLYTCRAKKSEKEMVFNLGKKDSSFATTEVPGLTQEQTYIGVSTHENTQSVSYGVAEKSKDDIFSFRKCALDRGLDLMCKKSLKPEVVNNCGFTDKLNEEENKGLLEALGNKISQAFKSGQLNYIKLPFEISQTASKVNIEVLHHCNRIPTIRRLVVDSSSKASIDEYEKSYQKAFAPKGKPAQTAPASTAKGDRKK